MNFGLILIVFLFIAGWFVLGFFLFNSGESGDGSDHSGEEWPKLAETQESYEIHALKGFLEEEGFEVLIEEESSEAGGIPTNITRAILRVEPGKQAEAMKVIEESDLDTKNYKFIPDATET